MVSVYPTPTCANNRPNKATEYVEAKPIRKGTQKKIIPIENIVGRRPIESADRPAITEPTSANMWIITVKNSTSLLLSSWPFCKVVMVSLKTPISKPRSTGQMEATNADLNTYMFNSIWLMVELRLFNSICMSGSSKSKNPIRRRGIRKASDDEDS